MNKWLVKVWLLLLIVGLKVNAQNPTVGLQYYNENVSDGYALFTPETNNFVYLINNCGEKINEWTFTELPGATCYLLENGNLLRAGKESIEIRDWDNNVVWTFLMSTIGLNQHHDIEPLPNGNVLCLITDNYTDTEMIALGRDASTMGPTFKLDKLIELQPLGVNDANLVWEWKFIDHFIQDFDNTKPNFGVVTDHPELLDLNFSDPSYSIISSDFTHVNAIDYNADLDQIIMSARHLNEIYIIDHSTTTAEAAGHVGGNSNKGGDLLWRWGNPRAYGQGTTSDQKLFLQHDSKWVESGYLDAGKISIFNNAGGGLDEFSKIHLITPEIINGVYMKENNKFKPLDFEWSWNGSFMETIVFERRKSGAMSLPNGNFIIAETGKGRVSEITKDGTQLWTYVNPSGYQMHNQFEIPESQEFFRAEKYPTDFIGFNGKDLTPLGLIEDVNSVSEDCIALLSIENNQTESLIVVNPVEGGTIKFNKIVRLNAIQITDLSGRIVFEHGVFEGNNVTINLPQAMYFMRLQLEDKIVTKKIIVK